MKYYIGIDGGGTKSHCLLLNEKREIVSECFGGPTNFLMLGSEPVCKTILDVIKECREKAKINLNQIDAVFIGTTGAGRRTDAQQLESDFMKYLREQETMLRNVSVESDALVALEGAFDGAPGSILIAGTGSIMYGKDQKDILYRVGGFGRFIGDEGSGYSIGKRGLIAVARHYDGRGTRTLLANLLGINFSIVTPEDLVISIYKKNFDIAAFAPYVFQAAEQNDSVARKIVEEEADELIKHIQAMKKKILVQTLDVAFVGSVLTTDNLLSALLKEKIKADCTDIRLVEAKHSPAFGAALLAIKKIS
jgi:N-acetylglucosamine kinase